MALSDQWQKNFLTLAGRTSEGMGARGAGDIGQASRFFQTLLGGDRTALERQAAPGLNAAQASAEAAMRQRSRTGTRTGGDAAANAAAQDQIRQAQQSGILGQQSTAAGSLAGIGGTELQTMMDALNIGATTAQSDINSRRAASAQMWSSLIGGAASVATGGMLGGFKGIFGGRKAPTPTDTSTPSWQGPIQQPRYNLGMLQPPIFPLPQQSPAGWDWPRLGTLAGP